MRFIERYLNVRMLLQFFPAVVFFTANYGWGLMAATAAVMIATVIAVGVGLALEGRVPMLACVTLALVLLLGGASLFFNDEFFIKIKATVGNCLFAAALGLGLLFRPPLLAQALESQVSLTTAGWRVLTLCWISFALLLAILNEIVWRTMDTDSWVAFKTLMDPLAIVGYVALTRFIAPHYWQEEPEPAIHGAGNE